MINVAFICLGNICRSPMAELLFKKIIKEEGIENSFVVDSFATSNWEVGNPIYPPAQKTLHAHGIEGMHRAQQITKRDLLNFDYFLVMDSENYSDMLTFAGEEHRHKVYKICAFTDQPRDVADPWYTRNFEKTYIDLLDGCHAFLNYIKSEYAQLLEYNSNH